MKAEEFVPTIPDVESRAGEPYGLMLVQLYVCANCKKPMLGGANERGWENSVFPHYLQANRAAQVKRAGWRDRSSVTDANDRSLCTECAPTAGAFKCALCGQDRHGKPQESFGDPAEYLCVPCYETVPAKVWEAKSRELTESHRYDFE